MAERSRLSINAISLLERGARKAPRRETIAALSAALDLDAGARLAFEGAARGRQPAREASAATAPVINLPVRATTFLGRRTELAQIRRGLTRSQLVTITGAGGIGKTRLALEVAALTGHSYSGGTVWLDLAQVNDAGSVAATLAAALQVPRDAPPAEAGVLAHVAERHLLIVLDNCERFIDEIALLASRILQAAPHVRILATSRERLRISGETAFVLPTLKLPGYGMPRARAQTFDGIALFVERAASTDSGFILTDDNAPLVVEICRRLQGIALAIEVVAARVSSLGLSQILRVLDDRQTSFQAFDEQTEAALKTLPATIAWSHSLLDDSERALFRRLSRFSSGCTIRGAEVVCAGDGLRVEIVADVLGSLVEKSLVTTEEHPHAMRYRFLESTRTFAEDRLIESGEREEIARRHAIWFGEVADRAHESEWSTPRNTWDGTYRPYLEDARLAVDWCLEAGRDAALAVRILAGFRGIWLDFGPELARRAEAALRHIDHEDVRHLALLYRVFSACTDTNSNFNPAFVDFADRAKRAFERAGDLSGLAVLHGKLAYELTLQGDLRGAQRLSEQALAYFRDAGAGRSYAYVAYLIHHGLRTIELGDPRAASQILDEALGIARSLRDHQLIGSASSAIAVVAFARGDPRRALRLTQKIIAKRWFPVGSHSEAVLIVDLAAYRVALDDRLGSLRSARIAIARTREKFPYNLFAALHHLAAALASNHLLEEAAHSVGYLRKLSRLRGYRGTMLETSSLVRYERIMHGKLAIDEVAAEEAIGADLTEAELLEQVAPQTA